jgi:hypothetical protein
LEHNAFAHWPKGDGHSGNLEAHSVSVPHCGVGDGASGTRLPIGGAGVGVGALVRLATVCDDELLDESVEAVVGTVQLRAPTPLAAPAHMHCAQ